MATRGAFLDTEEQREIYSYGLELQIYYIIHAVLLLALGFLFGRMLEVGLFLVLFGLMQSNGGGYHADTHGRCFAIMACGVLVFIALLSLYQDIFVLQLISVLAGLAAVVCLAPVAHKNHPLNPDISKRMGRKAKIWAVVISLAWCLTLFLDLWEPAGGIISFTMASCAVSMGAACLKKIRLGD